MAPLTPNQALQQAKDALDRALELKKQNESFMRSVGPAILEALTPLLEQLKTAVSSLKVDVTPNVTVTPNVHLPQIVVPEAKVTVTIPEIKVPEPKVTVNVPEIKIPKFDFPKSMEVEGFLRLIDWDSSLLAKPLPVQIRDAKGKPVDFSGMGAGSVMVEGASGGGFQYPTIAGFLGSSFSQLQNADGRLRVSVETGGSGLTDSELRAAHLDVQQLSGSIDSVNVVGFSASIAAIPTNGEGVAYNSDNPLPVTFPSTASLPVSQVSGSIFSVNVVSDTVTLDQSTDSILAYQVSGTAYSVNVVSPVAQGDAASAVRVVVAGNSDASVVVNNPQGPGEQATALRVLVAGDSSASVSVRDFNGNAPATGLNETNSGVLRVVQMTDSVASVVVNNPQNQGDVATALRVVVAGNSDASVVVNSGTLTGITNTITQVQLSGAADSVNVLQFNGNTPATGLNETNAGVLRVVQMTDSVASVVVNSGTVTVSSITATTAATIVDSSGVAYSGSNPVPTTASLSVAKDQGDAASAMRVVIAGNSDASVVVNSGTITSITNTVTVSGSLTSAITVGDIPSDGADTGSAPVKTGGIARTAQPGAVADGDRVTFTADKLGRQIVRPVQVRDLIKTAYVSVATGTETTLLAGVAGSFLDLIMLTASNNSSAATQLDIRAVTAGNIIHTMYLPATTGPVGWAPTVPWPQDNQGNNWTIDLPDITGTTVYVSALFSQEV